MSEKRKAARHHSYFVRDATCRPASQTRVRKHPDIEVTRVEVLTNRDRARRDGVNRPPPGIADGRTPAGIILTPRAIEQFLEQLDADPG